MQKTTSLDQYRHYFIRSAEEFVHMIGNVQLDVTWLMIRTNVDGVATTTIQRDKRTLRGSSVVRKAQFRPWINHFFELNSKYPTDSSNPDFEDGRR